MYSLPLSASGRTCRCSLQQSFECVGQLQFLPQVAAVPRHHQHAALTSSASAPNQQLLDWSFEEDQQLVESNAESRNGLQQQIAPHLVSAKKQSRRQQPDRRADERQNTWQQEQRPKRRTSGGRTANRSSPTAEPDRCQLAEAVSQQQQCSWRAGVQQPVATETLRMPVQTGYNRRHTQQEPAVDDYAAAQQRVRRLLISADINNPLAAAEAIPDTVNDIVIALQLLATAPKPSTMMAIKQYEMARQQISAAVVHKFKQLLVGHQQQQQQQQQQGCKEGSQPSLDMNKGQWLLHQGQPQLQMAAASAAGVLGLAAALEELPATKVAAATFSLGVLRHYDPDLVPALERASGRIMMDMLAAAEQQNRCAQHQDHSSSSSSIGRRSKEWEANRKQQPHNHHQQQQQQQGATSTGSAFNANQLGQLGQGFVYLDHTVSPQWQATYLDACRQQMRFMKPQQLASLAEFLIRYRHSSSSSSTAGSMAGLYEGQRISRILTSSNGHCLDEGWAAAYLKAAAAQVGGMKPSHLVSVLQAAAGMYRGWQQEHHEQLGQTSTFSCLPTHMPPAPAGASGTKYNSRRRSTSAATTPLSVAAHTNSSSSSPSSSIFGNSRASSPNDDTSDSRDWLLPLLEAFQVQLPDIRMSQLAAVLPALAAVTQKPWNKKTLLPLLLQVQLLLPASAGPEAVAVAAAVIQLGAAGDVRCDQDWCDAYLQRLHALMRTLGPGDLAAAVNTLAQLHIRPYKAWVYELCARLRVEVKNMSSHELIATLEGLADLRVKLDPEVLHLFVLGIKRWVGFMSPDDLARLVRALNQMYRRPNGRTILPGRTVQQLVEEMERRIKLGTLQQGRPL